MEVLKNLKVLRIRGASEDGSNKTMEGVKMEVVKQWRVRRRWKKGWRGIKS